MNKRIKILNVYSNNKNVILDAFINLIIDFFQIFIMIFQTYQHTFHKQLESIE